MISQFKNKNNEKLHRVIAEEQEIKKDLDKMVKEDNLRINNGAKAKNTEAVVETIDKLKQNRQDIDNAAADIIGVSEYEKFKENPLEYILSRREESETEVVKINKEK